MGNMDPNYQPTGEIVKVNMERNSQQVVTSVRCNLHAMTFNGDGLEEMVVSALALETVFSSFIIEARAGIIQLIQVCVNAAFFFR